MHADKLDVQLLEMPSKKGKAFSWTARNAVEGVQIFGGIGSGKTTGSGRTLAIKYLAAGYGGLVLTVKPQEKEDWEEYCALAGRKKEDIILVEPYGKHSFNFLDYESSHSPDGKAITENIVDLLKTVIQAAETRAHGKSDDPFWENAVDMLMYNIIDLCQLAYNKVSIEKIYEIIRSLPKSGSTEHGDFLEAYGITSRRIITPRSPQRLKAYQSAYLAAYRVADEKTYEWEGKHTTDQLEAFKKNSRFYEEQLLKEVTEARLMKQIDGFIEDYVQLNEKTRSIVDFSFTGFLFRFLRDPVYSLFCNSKITFTPEDCINGKIILLNLPVKLYHKIGRDCQLMFKYIWQRAMEKRKIEPDTLPVFLWADEAQNFLHAEDPNFLATARSSRVATVYISQNVPNYKANMGSDNSDNKIASFLGTLATKIFHSNADIATNEYASRLIGDLVYDEATKNFDYQYRATTNHNRRVERNVRPDAFSRLKTGTPMHKGIVDAIVHLQANFATNEENYLYIKFNRNFHL